MHYILFDLSIAQKILIAIKYVSYMRKFINESTPTPPNQKKKRKRRKKREREREKHSMEVSITHCFFTSNLSENLPGKSKLKPIRLKEEYLDVPAPINRITNNKDCLHSL